jgi:hypothetical protein
MRATACGSARLLRAAGPFGAKSMANDRWFDAECHRKRGVHAWIEMNSLRFEGQGVSCDPQARSENRARWIDHNLNEEAAAGFGSRFLLCAYKWTHPQPLFRAHERAQDRLISLTASNCASSAMYSSWYGQAIQGRAYRRLTPASPANSSVCAKRVGGVRGIGFTGEAR